MYSSKNYISELNAEEVARRIRLYETKAEQRIFDAGNRLNVFLSHKHDEGKLVLSIKSILESLNTKVYVDWEDASMPPEPNAQTANRLKEKIQSLDKFIFVASNGAIGSKWCNWEIGYGDAYKYKDDKLLIFPVRDRQGWNGSEYLSLYPRIIYIPFDDNINYGNLNFGNPDTGSYWVLYPDSTKVLLTDWLKK